jgi:metal-sulfur cluster biosynthetic enzyme
MQEITQDKFIAALKTVIDPIAKEDLITSGKVRFFEILGRTINIEVEVLSPALHIKKKQEAAVRGR